MSQNYKNDSLNEEPIQFDEEDNTNNDKDKQKDKEDNKDDKKEQK